MISVVLSTHEVNGHMAFVGASPTHEAAVKIAEQYRGRVPNKRYQTLSNVFENTRQAKKFVQARNRGLSHTEALKEAK